MKRVGRLELDFDRFQTMLDRLGGTSRTSTGTRRLRRFEIAPDRSTLLPAFGQCRLVAGQAKKVAHSLELAPMTRIVPSQAGAGGGVLSVRDAWRIRLVMRRVQGS